MANCFETMTGRWRRTEINSTRYFVWWIHSQQCCSKTSSFSFLTFGRTNNIILYLQVTNGLILRRSKLIINILYYYLWVRIFIYAALFGMQLTYDNYGEWCEIINYYIIFEAFLCVMVLLFGLLTLMRYFEMLNLHDERDKSRLKNEFIFMMMFCGLRLVLNLLFLILQEKLLEEPGKQKCVNNEETLLSYINTICYLIAGILGTHQLPVVLILRIYKVNTSMKSVKNSSLKFSLID